MGKLPSIYTDPISAVAAVLNSVTFVESAGRTATANNGTSIVSSHVITMDRDLGSLIPDPAPPEEPSAVGDLLQVEEGPQPQVNSLACCLVCEFPPKQP